MIKPPFNRVGKKAKILPTLFAYFPKYEAFIEPFAGSGCVGLNSGAKYIFLNDLDSNVSETWLLLQDPAKREALIDYIADLPYSDAIFAHFKTMQSKNEIEKSAKFLILSSWGYLGNSGTLKYETSNSKRELLKKLTACVFDDKIKWACKDFRCFLNSISLKDSKDIAKSFIYCDPPYLGTTQNTYNTPTFKTQDLTDLVDLCVSKGCKFAVSEFENDTILMLKEKHGLYLNIIGKVRNLKNRRIEILLTNYAPENKGLFE